MILIVLWSCIACANTRGHLPAAFRNVFLRPDLFLNPDSAEARAPFVNLSSASKIFGPYISDFRSPNPGTARSWLMERGRFRHNSSSEVSCITTNAGTPCSCAVARRHSRRYSRSSGSTAEPVALAYDPECADGGGIVADRARIRDAGCFTTTVSANQSSPEPHASQASHFSNFEFSPKCEQICR